MTHRVSLTVFMDYLTASGPTKITKVRNALAMYQQTDYLPPAYYHQLKKAIAECFGGAGVIALDRCVKGLVDDRKVEGYGANVDGIKQWAKKAKPKPGFVVPMQVWTSGKLEVKVNPELGLLINGEPYVIKTYFKDDKLDQRKVDPVLHLLHMTHGSLGRVGILDCRRGRLFEVRRQHKGMNAFLVSEATGFVSLWEQLAA